MKTVTGGQSLIHSLYKEGVRVIFGLPGVQIYQAVISILEYPNIKFITTRHEQATTCMAEGYARASGKIGVSMVVPGPGLQNASAGITNAYASSTPILVISGQIPRADISQNRGLLHEINNQMDIIKPITKWQTRVVDAQNINMAVKEAFFNLRTGRPRPVEIEMPPEALEEFTSLEPYESLKTKPSFVNGAAIEDAAATILKARNPVIWAGGGIHISRASTALLRLSKYLQIPVLTTPEGKGAISDQHYLSLGCPQGRSTGQSIDPLRDFFYTCDLVIAIGTRFATAQAHNNQHVIQIDIDGQEIGRNHQNTLGIEADARLALEQLLEALKTLSVRRKSKKKEFSQLKSANRCNAYNQIEPQESYVRALRDSIPNNGILVTDMTIISYYARSHYPTYKSGSYITSSYSGNLGSALPTAMGVKIARPKLPVVSISGDGGFLFNSQELATAAQYDIGVIAVVFNDSAYGNVKRDMKELFDGKSLGVQLTNPDFMKLAEAYGIRGIRTNSPDGLRVALADAIRTNKPTLIEVLVDTMPSPF